MKREMKGILLNAYPTGKFVSYDAQTLIRDHTDACEVSIDVTSAVGIMLKKRIIDLAGLLGSFDGVIDGFVFWDLEGDEYRFIFAMIGDQVEEYYEIALSVYSSHLEEYAANAGIKGYKVVAIDGRVLFDCCEEYIMYVELGNKVPFFVPTLEFYEQIMDVSEALEYKDERGQLHYAFEGKSHSILDCTIA